MKLVFIFCLKWQIEAIPRSYQLEKFQLEVFMNSIYKKFYLLSIIGILAISAYPLYMGTVTISDYMRNGSIDVSDYQKYIIPYTPICIALILSIALIPLIVRMFKRYALLAASIFGTGVFFASEIFFENMIVMDGMTKANIESWQMLSCLATPEVWRSVGNPLIKEYSPAFKIHFYVIAIVIILAVLNVIYGLSKMIIENNFTRKKPLIAQAVSTAIFIGLCILACFTAFFRNGTINISPLSAFLMSLFFIVFGITTGVFIGSFFFGGKRRRLMLIVPAILSILTTVVMYIGELILTSGVLFKFGKGVIFEPIGVLPFATIDLMVICLSGISTYCIMRLLAKPQRII